MRRNNMTVSKYFKVMSLIIVSAFVFSIAFAQEKAAEKKDDITKLPDGSYRSKQFDESNRPEDNYLAKFHANDMVDRLMKKNLDEIYLLKVIISNNSGKNDWNTKYQELYNGYKDGMEQYYKRNVIYACEKLEKNQLAINELFKVIIEDYKKQCDDLLNECAGKVLLLHLDVSSRIDPDKAEQLATDHLKLKVAYGQLDNADSATISKYYPGAVYHLRVARSYGISILEDMAKDENEKKSILEKYKVVKADNLNRVFGEKVEKKEETKTK
jgi:hypothetical protein